MKTREQLIAFNAQKLGLPLAKYFFRPFKPVFQIDELQQLPEGTLGNDLYHFMQANNISMLPQFHAHDIKHVLLNYTTSIEDEACLQFFYLGNRFYSLPTLGITTFFMLVMPERWSKFRTAFQRGRASGSVGRLKLETMLNMSTKEVQTIYQIKP